MSDNENSLGDQNTFDGGDGQLEPQSLGDEMTLGGSVNDADDSFDDGMEVVDLEARYEIEGVLGKGGMGEVLLARDKILGRRVAIKRMKGESVNSRTAVSRFLSEARAIAKLEHPNIVDVYDSARSSDGPFMVMQYIDGGNLLDLCEEGKIARDQAIDLICRLCDALAVCHAAGVIHRDIKPSNILITKDGSPRLTDFGLVKDESEDFDKTIAGAVLGTLDFMPPEQRKDAKLVDARSDLWSLAATFYQLITGNSPRIIKLNTLPTPLQSVLEKALEESKEARYQTASEFRDALMQLRKPKHEVGNRAHYGLKAGECPSCHTINETGRKFCRECASLLRTVCLSCDEDMPVWDKICGECGGRQELLAKQNAAFESAFDLFSEGEFEKAFKELNGLDMSGIDEERENLWSTIQISKEADDAFREKRFQDCLRTLESISLVDANQACRKLEEQAEKNLDTLESLIEKIDLKREKAPPQVLIPLLEEAIKLSVDPSKLEAELQRLLALEARNQETRTEALRNAKQLFKEKNYPACIGELQRIDPSLVDHESRTLQKSAEENRDRLRELLTEIENSRIGVNPEKVLQLTLEAIELSQNSKFLEEKRSLIEQQIKEERSIFVESLTNARKALNDKQYKIAVQQLSSISPFLENTEVHDLRKKARDSDERLLKVLSELDSCQNTSEPNRQIELLDEAINLSPEPEKLKRQKKKLEARDKESRTVKFEQLNLANRLYEKKDFKSCLQELEKIESYLFDDSCQDLREKAAKNSKQFIDLLAEIETLEGQDPKSLLPILDNAIALSNKPYQLELQRDRVRKEISRNKLVLIESTEKAREYLVKNEFDKVIQTIDQVSSYVMTDECRELSKTAEERKQRRKELRQIIKDKVSRKDVLDLVPLITEAISLEKSRHQIEKLEKLKSQAASKHDRLEGQGEMFVSDAKVALMSADYESALSLIEQVPKGFESNTCQDIREKSRELESLRDKAIESLEKQRRKSVHSLKTKQCDSYLHRLEQERVRDQKFKSLLIIHKQKSLQKRQELKHKVKWRVISLAACLAVCGGIYGAKLHYDNKKTKLADAIAERRWEDALFLDQNSEPALFGMTEELLSRTPLDSDLIKTYLARLETRTSSRSRLKDLRKKSHISIAVEATSTRNISLAELEIEKAVQLGAQKAELELVYGDLTLAYQKRAIRLLEDGNWTAARQACEKSITYSGEPTSINSLLAESYEQEGDQHLRSEFGEKAIAAFKKAKELDSNLSLQSKIDDAEHFITKDASSEESGHPGNLGPTVSSSAPASKPMAQSEDNGPDPEIIKAESDASEFISNYAKTPEVLTRKAALEALARLKELAPSSPALSRLEGLVEEVDNRVNRARLQASDAVSSFVERPDSETFGDACDAIVSLVEISPSHPSLRTLLLNYGTAFTAMNRKLMGDRNQNAVWINDQKMRSLCKKLGSGDASLFSHQFYWFEENKLFFANSGDSESHLVADFSEVEDASSFGLAIDAVRNEIVIGCTMAGASIRLWKIDLLDFQISVLYQGKELGGGLEDLFIIPSTGDIIVAPHSLSVNPGGTPGGMQLVSYDGSKVSTMRPKTWYRHDFDYSPKTDTIYYSAFMTYDGKTASGFAGIRSMKTNGEEERQLAALPLQVQLGIDPDRDIMYLTKNSPRKGASNTVHKLSLNTSEADVAFQVESVTGIHHIDFDPVTQRLIWTARTDNGNDTIQSILADGSDRQVLFEKPTSEGKFFGSFASRTILKAE